MKWLYGAISQLYSMFMPVVVYYFYMQQRVRSGFIYVLYASLIFGGVYWYHLAHSACRTPLQYDIGSIDPRFNISKDEVQKAAADAESLWEDATGKNLFTYTPGASFKINFVYDERQDATTKAENAKESLDSQQSQSETIRAQYRDLTQKYTALKTIYEQHVADYQKRLNAYNAEVASWNKKGGAPKDVFAHLADEQNALAAESKSLNATAQELNRLVSALNALGKQGNQVVTTYNQNVAWYNKFFGTGREFTQGEYRGDRINVYQFKDQNELRLVLAHELGHAISLDHVKDSQSVMYYLMEGQTGHFKLSSADLVEYNRVCGAK